MGGAIRTRVTCGRGASAPFAVYQLPAWLAGLEEGSAYKRRINELEIPGEHVCESVFESCRRIRREEEGSLWLLPVIQRRYVDEEGARKLELDADVTRSKTGLEISRNSQAL